MYQLGSKLHVESSARIKSANIIEQVMAAIYLSMTQSTAEHRNSNSEATLSRAGHVLGFVSIHQGTCPQGYVGNSNTIYERSLPKRQEQPRTNHTIPSLSQHPTNTGLIPRFDFLEPPRPISSYPAFGLLAKGILTLSTRWQLPHYMIGDQTVTTRDGRIVLRYVVPKTPLHTLIMTAYEAVDVTWQLAHFLYLDQQYLACHVIVNVDLGPAIVTIGSIWFTKIHRGETAPQDNGTLPSPSGISVMGSQASMQPETA